jgi:hypothetical protein
VVLPDKVLMKLATQAWIMTILELKEEVPEWVWVDEYSESVLAMLRLI